MSYKIFLWRKTVCIFPVTVFIFKGYTKFVSINFGLVRGKFGGYSPCFLLLSYYYILCSKKRFSPDIVFFVLTNNREQLYNITKLSKKTEELLDKLARESALAGLTEDRECIGVMQGD